MSDRNSEDIIGALYDMVQDARSMPLAADKCILERDKVLDMLDEIIAQLPAELKQSRTIVESRNELISQARREAENIVRQAQEQSKQMVTKEAIYAEAKKRSEELVAQTQNRIDQLPLCLREMKILFISTNTLSCTDMMGFSLISFIQSHTQHHHITGLGNHTAFGNPVIFSGQTFCSWIDQIAA